ncbi:MAG: SRPBCC family protein [bacterium]|nr:SRPBCC family protein [bacterium]
MSKEVRHYENNTFIAAPPEKVFDYADDHKNFSSHMNQSSWMMGGGRMETQVDEGLGQKVGSHIRMSGKVFGVEVSLDEVVIKHEPPYLKAWETVGSPKLLVIGNYQMVLEIKPENSNSNLKVSIDYEIPESPKTRWLGDLFGGVYAKWCVSQMINGVKTHFG